MFVMAVISFRTVQIASCLVNHKQTVEFVYRPVQRVLYVNEFLIYGSRSGFYEARSPRRNYTPARLIPQQEVQFSKGGFSILLVHFIFGVSMPRREPSVRQTNVE